MSASQLLIRNISPPTWFVNPRSHRRADVLIIFWTSETALWWCSYDYTCKIWLILRNTVSHIRSLILSTLTPDASIISPAPLHIAPELRRICPSTSNYPPPVVWSVIYGPNSTYFRTSNPIDGLKSYLRLLDTLARASMAHSNLLNPWDNGTHCVFTTMTFQLSTRSNLRCQRD